MADKIADNVQELYEVARNKADTNFRADYDLYWSYYMARQWPGDRASYRSDIVPNLSFSNIETIKPILTDNRPNFMVMGRGGDAGDRVKAKIGNAILRYLWDVTNMDLKLPEGLTSGLALGTAFWMIYFDRSLNGGLGELNIAPIHPKFNHPDPAATSMEDSRYNIVESMVPLSILRETYGAAAAEVKSDVSLDDLYSRMDSSQLQEATAQGLPSYAVGTTPPTSSVPYGRTNMGDGGGDLVRLLRCWVRPGGALDNAKGPRSPGGRLIHVANHVTLRDVPNPFSWCPVVRFVDHVLPSCFWGMGEIQETITIQKALNMQIARLADHSALCSNPRMLCDASIYEDVKDKLTNKPGQILPIENPDGRPLDSLIHWQVPPSIPLYTMRLIEIYQRLFEIVSGIHDVTQGRAPAGIEAGIAIEALQVETKRRIGLKVRNMEASLKQLGKLLLSGVETFWSTERLIQVSDAEEPMSVTKDMFKDFEYDVKVEAGSSLPVDKAAVVMEAENLVKLGVYDEEQLLEIKDPPNKEELKKRMGPLWALKKAVMMAGLQKQLEIASQPMPPPGTGGPGGPGGGM